MILFEALCELGSDHHGFVVGGVRPSNDATPAIETNTLISWPQDEDQDMGLVVLSGSQWGPFAVVTRVHDADPGLPGKEWEDLVELSVIANGEVAISEIVDGPVADIEGVSGSYRVRVAARGRTESAERDRSLNEDEDGSADGALEHYRIEFWPVEPTDAVILREGSQYAKDLVNPPVAAVLPEEAAGLGAAWAVIRDLRGDPGARSIAGGTSTITIEMQVSGTPTKVFNRVRYATGWNPSNGLMASPDEYATRYHDLTLPDDPYGFNGPGQIAMTLVELDKPRRVAYRWNLVPESGGSIDERPPLLSEDTTVTITVTKGPTEAEGPSSKVTLTHDGIPAVWQDDLERLWRWDLATWAAH